MAIFIDINPRFGQSASGELVTDVEAINASIENILGTVPGERLFLPTFGSQIHQLLFNPIDPITASDLRSETILAIERWEPRVRIIDQETSIEAQPDNNKYLVNINYIIVNTGSAGTFNRFLLADT